MSRAVGRPTRETPRAEAHDEEFASRLELWGGAHRVVVACLGLVVMLLGVEGYEPVAVLVPYLAVALGTFLSLRRRPRPMSETWLGQVLLAMDVGTVAALGYVWGTSSSPIMWMNVPLVLGWTLVTRRRMGRSALSLVVGLTALLLGAEQLGLIPTAPLVNEAAPVTGQQRLFFFGCLTLALGAGHFLVKRVMARLRRHAAAVSQLESERRLQARDQELAQRLDQRQRLEALGRLAGGVAHDFNNMLTGLAGLAEVAEQRLSDDPVAARRALAELLRYADRAARLTTQLLDYARTQPREPVATDLAAALIERRPLLEQLVLKRMRLSVHGTPQCWVDIDPSELSRLVLNLAANAVDAARDDGELRVTVARDGERVRLTVQDDGVGIAARDLPRVFEPFFTTKPTGEGSGLGLSAVFGIVRRSGGDVDLQSKPGQGTTVIMTWPAASPATPASLLPGATTDRAGGSEAPGHPAPDAPLLVVDDDEAVRLVVEAQLATAGYPVELADGPDAALRSLAQRPMHHYRMLITDVVMPGITGLQLAQRFSQHSPGAPVLFISGYPDDVLHGLESHCTMLEKPFTARQLLQAVERAMANAP